MAKFKLDDRLCADTIVIGDSGLCRIMLMNDSRFPWLIMVPMRADVCEIHELTPLDQTVLTFEITQTAKILKETTGCKKINIGALGNMVPQLHVHVIARNEHDDAWPGPVWGYGKASPYDNEALKSFTDRFSSALQRAS